MIIKLGILELIYSFAASYGIFLVFLLLSKKGVRTKNVLLAILTSIFSIYLLEHVLYTSGYLMVFPHFYLVSAPLTFLIPPLFYHYIKFSIDKTHRFKYIHLFHLTLFIFQIFVLSSFYQLDATGKIDIYELSLSNKLRNGLVIQYWSAVLIYILSSFYFFSKGYIKLKNTVEKGFRKKQNIKWLNVFTLSIIIYLVFRTSLVLLSYNLKSLLEVNLHFNLMGLTLLIFGLAYSIYAYPDIFRFSINQKLTYRYSSMTNHELSVLREKTIAVLIKDKVYLKHDLTPQYLAAYLGISKNNLSQLLSRGMNLNFYDLINHYRIEEAKRILAKDVDENLKIVHIGYDSGFSSKSSFLRNFKKITGHTPSGFRDNALH